jgi:hypothetical protein
MHHHGRVIKTDAMCPFCVNYHIDIHHDMLVASVLMRWLHSLGPMQQKKSLHLSCPHYVWQLKTNLVTIGLVIKTFQLPFLW